MITGDGAYIKKINRSIILSKIIECGMISRADLSKITGLNKATISIQVSDLLGENLICETTLEHNVVGRRPIMLSINKEAGYVLGIDLDYKHIQYTVSDLGGNPVRYDSIALETDDYEDIVHLLIKHIKEYQNDYSNSYYGLVSVMIGIHGTVNKDDSIYFVPTYQWKNKSLKTDLNKELAITISIQNNANLSAYAERVYKHHESNNLLCIILTSGIGSGIMIDGKLLKGFHGYAGEMGHMIISKDGEECRCGNNGCWELYSSEPSLLARLSKQLDISKLTPDDVITLIAKQDPITLQIMKQYIIDLSIGLNNIINIYNPETLVLTSELLKMYPNAIDEIKSNLNSTVSQFGDIVISDFGNSSCAMGACALAIQRFLEVPELILTPTEDAVLIK
ncbi:ROK family protein [Sporosarcina sp. YIM B06819]|uniref:ROK family protein n=1 Tax=Sporosarcina sp. YIM B06819 TaxID=3081769 RepID=UPI00298C3141|nr:ROK family protein [Sporosarcina sp. YIM B06819]